MCLKQPSLIATPPTQTQCDLEIAVGNAEASLRSCNQEEQEQLEFLIRFAKACIAKKKVRESCRVHEVYAQVGWIVVGFASSDRAYKAGPVAVLSPTHDPKMNVFMPKWES